MRPKKHETTGSGDLFRAQRRDRTAVQRQWSAWNCDTVCDRAFFAQAYLRPADEGACERWDGHTLGAVIEATQRLTGREIERAYVDKGYRGHDAPNPRRVFIS